MKKNPVDMDMSRPRKIVYHETEAPKGLMIYLGAEQEWYDKGWVNTSANFDKKAVVDKPTNKPGKVDLEKIPVYLRDKYLNLEKLAVKIEAQRLDLEKREANLEAKELEEEKIDKSTENADFENPEKIEDALDLSHYLNQKYDMQTNFRMGLRKLKKILKRKLDDNSSEDN